MDAARPYARTLAPEGDATGYPLPGKPSEPRGHKGLIGLVVVLLLALSATRYASAAQSASNAPAPFLNLRARALDYSGPKVGSDDLPEIRLGWFGPNDPTNTVAADMWWAANLAVDEANEKGGCGGRPFRLVPRWSADPWGSGVAQLARMVYEERPIAILGGVDSASTHLAEQVAAKANLALVSPVATDKTITLAGVPWMFSCAPSDSAIAHVLVEAVCDDAGGSSNRLALLSGTDHESRMTAGEVLRRLSRRGRLPSFRFEFSPGATTMDRQITALAESCPDRVLIIAAPEDAARLVVAVREAIPTALLFGSHQMGRAQFREPAGAASEGVRFPLLFAPLSAPGSTARFMKEFEAVHHRAADYTAAMTYDATRLLLEAARRVGPNRAGIREALAHLPPWQGVSGSICFDGTGQNTRADIIMGTIQNGRTVPLVNSQASLHAATTLSPP